MRLEVVLGGRELSNNTWVPLCEALTWIAFGDALTLDELRAQVEGESLDIEAAPEERLREFFTTDASLIPHVPGFVPSAPGTGHFANREAGLQQFADAWQKLRDGVERETIKVRGRHTANYSPADAELADVSELTGSILATFSQFDVSTGGIRRRPEGTPSILWRNHPQSFDRELESFVGDVRAAGGYLRVEVERAGLTCNTVATGMARAPSTKTGRPPTDDVILAKADEMKARGMNGRTIAQQMRREPGFENVATTTVRELIKGRWKPGGRPKKKPAY